MRAIIFREALRDALASVLWAVPNTTTVPILGCVLIEAVGDGLTLRGTDCGVEAEAHVACDMRIAGACAVSARILHHFISGLPEGAALILETADDRADLKLASGRVKAALRTLPAADFPEPMRQEGSFRFTLSAPLLSQLLTRVAFAAATGADRPALQGVYLHAVEGPGGSMLRACATDGHRLALAEVPLPAGAAGMPAVILPRNIATDLIRLCKDVTADLEVELAVRTMRVTLARAAFTTTITSKTIAAEFPNYLPLLLQANEKQLTLDRASFAATLDRMTVIAGPRGRCVKLACSPGRLALSAVGEFEPSKNALGSRLTADEEVDASYAGPAIEIGCNGQLLQQFVEGLTDDTIVLRLDAPHLALIAAPQGRSHQLYVLMPMRI